MIKDIKLFGVLSLLKIKISYKNSEKLYKIIFLGVFPILLIKEKNYKQTFLLFNILPLFVLKCYPDVIKLINEQMLYNISNERNLTKKEIGNTKIPIFFPANNNNIPALATAIVSILSNTNSFCEFYILESDVTDYNKKLVEKIKRQFANFSIEWIRVKPEEDFKDLSVESLDGKKRNWTAFYDIYTRFLIPTLKPNIKKAIYIDYDIVVLGDIKELYEKNLDNYSLGGIYDIYVMSQMKEHFKDVDLAENHIYFGSGILLMDCEKLRNENFFERMMEIGRKYKQKVIFPDQDMLNIYFNNNGYKLLDFKYGVLANYKKYISILLNNPNIPQVEREYLEKFDENDIIIQHFTGDKPWNKYLDYNWKEWWYYTCMTPFYNRAMENFKKKNIV